MSWRKVLVVAEAAAVLAVGCSSDAPAGLGRGGDFGDYGGSAAVDAGTGGRAIAGSGGSAGATTGGKGGAVGTGTGGTGTGGKSGASTGGSGTGGRGSASTGGKGGASTGGKGGTSTGGKGGSGPTTCNPDPAFLCDNCIETKCCQEWLDCVNDDHCFMGNQPEFTCIQDCLINDGSSFPGIDECAATCQHDPVGVSVATSSLIACMRDTGDAGTQNCTNECFGREI